ncbi:MAG: hypothetical protein LBF19_03900 [Prevotellaceae bacterium]|jgi:hypothetical protein|nr:hypothetical protein [Prevotellaceae bacterium]
MMHHPVTIYSILFLSGLGGVILVSILVLALCVAGLAIKLLLRKNGTFPNTHIRDNKNMRKRGITCVQEDELNRAKNMQGSKDSGSRCDSCTTVCPLKE